MIIYCNSKDIDTFKVKEFYCNYATWKVSNKYDDWETIIDVLVHPNYRGQSIGIHMIEKLLEEQEMKVRTIYLATPDKENFYTKLGFKTANEHCSYMIKVQNLNEHDYILPVE